jgi:hypothetical protein
MSEYVDDPRQWRNLFGIYWAFMSAAELNAINEDICCGDCREQVEFSLSSKRMDLTAAWVTNSGDSSTMMARLQVFEKEFARVKEAQNAMFRKIKAWCEANLEAVE